METSPSGAKVISNFKEIVMHLKKWLFISIFLLLATIYACKKDNIIKSSIDGIRIGGEGCDEGYDIIEGVNGGYVLLGTIDNGYGRDDVTLIKTDDTGNIEWSKIFGGSEEDVANSVIRTIDNCYVIAGATRSYLDNENFDVYLIKTDQTGNLLWYKTYGGENYERCYSIEQTSDYGFILLGFTDSYGNGDNDMYLIKTDSLGNEIWSKTYGTSGYEIGYSVKQTTDGAFLLLGKKADYTESLNYDMYLVKTDSAGNEKWSKSFGGDKYDIGSSMLINNDGTYMLLGTSSSFNNDDASYSYLIKTDTAGNLIWSKTFGKGDGEDGNDICKSLDGGYAITGSSGSYRNGISRDLYFLRIDNVGNVLSEIVFGDKNNQRGEAIIQNSNGQFATIGITHGWGKSEDNDIYLLIY